MELVEPTLQMCITFAIVVGAIIAYAYDRIPLEISSISTVAILLFVFEIMPLLSDTGENMLTTKDLLQGFADPALITIMALLVVGQGLVQTGALNGPARMIVAFGKT